MQRNISNEKMEQWPTFPHSLKVKQLSQCVISSIEFWAL